MLSQTFQNIRNVFGLKSQINAAPVAHEREISVEVTERSAALWAIDSYIETSLNSLEECAPRFYKFCLSFPKTVILLTCILNPFLALAVFRLKFSDFLSLRRDLRSKRRDLFILDSNMLPKCGRRKNVFQARKDSINGAHNILTPHSNKKE